MNAIYPEIDDEGYTVKGGPLSAIACEHNARLRGLHDTTVVLFTVHGVDAAEANGALAFAYLEKAFQSALGACGGAPANFDRVAFDAAAKKLFDHYQLFAASKAKGRVH